MWWRFKTSNYKVFSAHRDGRYWVSSRPIATLGTKYHMRGSLIRRILQNSPRHHMSNQSAYLILSISKALLKAAYMFGNLRAHNV